MKTNKERFVTGMSGCKRKCAYYGVVILGLLGLGYLAGSKPALAAAPPIGINIQSVSDYNGDLLFADAFKSSRDWENAAGGAATADSNGWPTQDANIYVWAGASTSADMSGTYALSFNGQATVAAGGTISGQVYNSGTNTTTATLTMTNTDNHMTFTNTIRTFGGATNTGITNVKLMRPNAQGGSTPYSTATTFGTGIKNFLAKFNVIRFMDFLATNSNQQVNWTDRVTPSFCTQQVGRTGYGWQGVGGSLEYAIQLCNETGKDMWVNIPEAANDAYVSNVAKMIAFGSDGVNPYSSTQASPVYAPLNSGLKVYVEFSNEVWNTGGAFGQSGMNHTSAISEVNAGGSPLNFDGDTNDWNWAARRMAKRTVEISNAFRTIFGSPAMMTRVRPVLESQLGNAGLWLFQQTHMLQDYYNTSRAGTAHPPSYYIYGGGGSAYYGPDDAGTWDLTSVWTSQTFADSAWATTIQEDMPYTLANYGKRVAYEGGPSLDTCGCSTDNNKEAVWGDSRLTTLFSGHQTIWNQQGGDLLVYFDSVGNYQWGFTHNVWTLTSAKMNGVTNVDASTQAVSTVGTSIPGNITAASFTAPPNKTWAAPDPGTMAASGMLTYLAYIVNNSAAGAFNIALHAGSAGTGNQAGVYVDGQLVGNITVANTGSNATMQNTGTVTTVTLAPGSHGLLIKAAAGSYGFDTILITNGTAQSPPAPTGLTATAGNAQVALSWSASTGATSYNVSRSTVSGSGYASVATGISTTSYTNTGLTNGTTYYFVVSATNASGTSANSAQASATPTSGGTSGPVKINAGGPAASPFIADADFSGGTAATNWTGTIDTSAVTNPAPQAVYQPERYGASTYTIGGLTPSTNYTVRLHFCENYFTASGLRVFNVTINGVAALTNFDIYATAGAIHKANCQQFTAASNASGQIIVAFVNVTNNGLINGIEVNTISPPAAPTGLTATPGNAQIALSWTASSGATSYNIYRGTAAGGESGTAIVTGISTTSYTNTGLTNGTTYFYTVKAVNAGGTSGASNEASATPTSGGTSGPVKINAGGPAASPFIADADFSGGTAATNWTGTIDTSAVTNPAPQAVYQPERYGASTYTIGGLTPSTNYTVRLHFCENYFTASGLRVFNVTINGTAVLTNFDIYATTGAIHKANCQQFTAAANGSGQIVIAFANVTNNGLINGIEVNTLSGPPSAPTGLTATSGNLQVPLSWTASSGATTYNVYRGTAAGGEAGTAIKTGVTTTSYTDTGLTNGQIYYYKVTAVSSGGESAKSNEASATPNGNTHNGTWALKGVFTTTATWANATQVPNVTAGQTYAASFWMKGSGAVVLRIMNGTWGTEITSQTYTATANWTQYQITGIATGANTQVTYAFSDGGGIAGTAYIDDCFLGVANGSNTLTNQGFESGNTVWGANAPFSIVQNP